MVCDEEHIQEYLLRCCILAILFYLHYAWRQNTKVAPFIVKKKSVIDLKKDPLTSFGDARMCYNTRRLCHSRTDNRQTIIRCAVIQVQTEIDSREATKLQNYECSSCNFIFPHLKLLQMIHFKINCLIWKGSVYELGNTWILEKTAATAGAAVEVAATIAVAIATVLLSNIYIFYISLYSLNS